jgi:hypothetical protein
MALSLDALRVELDLKDDENELTRGARLLCTDGGGFFPLSRQCGRQSGNVVANFEYALHIGTSRDLVDLCNDDPTVCWEARKWLDARGLDRATRTLIGTSDDHTAPVQQLRRNPNLVDLPNLTSKSKVAIPSQSVQLSANNVLIQQHLGFM